MQKIKVGFSRSSEKSFAGNIIMKVMDTDYSHTYIHLPETNEIFEAEFVGTRLMDYDKWLLKVVVVDEVEIEISDERYEELMKFIDVNDGIPYGFDQLARILWSKLGGKVFIDNAEKRYICSELVARALADILGIKDDELDLITPKNIRQLVKALKIKLRNDRQ